MHSYYLIQALYSSWEVSIRPSRCLMAHWHLLHLVVYYIVLVALLWLVALPSHSIRCHVYHAPTLSIPGSQPPTPYICNLWYLKVFWRKINKFNKLAISCLVLLLGNELYLLWKFQVVLSSAEELWWLEILKLIFLKIIKVLLRPVIILRCFEHNGAPFKTTFPWLYHFVDSYYHSSPIYNMCYW